MERYRIKLKKKYKFDLDGMDEKDIKDKINDIMCKTRILDMPFVNKKIKVNIKILKKGKRKNETDS